MGSGIWVVALTWPEEGISSHAQRVENQPQALMGMSEMAGESDTEDSSLSMVLSSGVGPFRDSSAVCLIFASQ